MLNHKGTQEIVTERLLLRKYRITDSENMFKNYTNDERVTRFLTWEPYTNSEDTKEFLQATIDTYEKDSTYNWAIEYEGEIIGGISAMFIDDMRRNCEAGYCIGYDV